MMNLQEATDLVYAEILKAQEKHPVWPSDQIHAVGLVIEEAGEAMQAALDNNYGGGVVADIQVELAHTAGVAIRALMNLPRRG